MGSRGAEGRRRWGVEELIIFGYLANIKFG